MWYVLGTFVLALQHVAPHEVERVIFNEGGIRKASFWTDQRERNALP